MAEYTLIYHITQDVSTQYSSVDMTDFSAGKLLFCQQSYSEMQLAGLIFREMKSFLSHQKLLPTATFIAFAYQFLKLVKKPAEMTTVTKFNYKK